MSTMNIQLRELLKILNVITQPWKIPVTQVSEPNKAYQYEQTIIGTQITFNGVCFSKARWDLFYP